MKNKIWNLTCMFSVLAVVSLLIALASIFWDYRIFLFEIGILAAALIFVYICIFKFKCYINNTLKYADESLNTENRMFLNNMSMPVLIVGEYDNILWANSLFFSNIEIKDKCIGENIQKYTNGLNVDSLQGKDSINTIIGDKKYTVFISEFQKGIILLFVDDTVYKNAVEEKRESKPCVVIANFDNGEEILENNSESGMYTQVVADIEKILNEWALDSNGFFKKLSNGRYLIIFEERSIEKYISEKFSILDRVRNIKLGENRFATVSIGIGHCGNDFEECERWARKALEMALGRGGDQVVVKNGNDFSFFGGVSKGVEKRDRVRTRIVASMLADNIKKSDVVLIMGHRYSDLDSIGASIGMWGIVKNTSDILPYIVVNMNESLAVPLIDYAVDNGAQDAFISVEKAMSLVTEKSLLIIVDTHSAGFTESRELYEKCYNIVVIDHHRMIVNHIKNSSIFYHDPYASSASEMVTDLSRYMGENALKSFEAQAMLAGIVLDTKSFVLRTGVRTFEAAALLKNIGADMVEVKKLFTDSIDTYRTKYKIISQAKMYNGYAFSHIQEKTADMRISAAQAADELLGIQGVKASFVIYETDESINISARSFGDVNVQLLMEQLGGGGHQTMAGVQLRGKTIEDVEEQLLEIVKKEEVAKNKLITQNQ